MSEAETHEQPADDGRVDLSLDDALAALDVQTDVQPDGTTRQYVHCFLSTGNNMLVGADWRLEEVRALFERVGAEVAGATAMSMHHGIGVRDGMGGTYFATHKDWTPPTKSTR